MLFIFGLIILLITSIVELNPARIKNSSAFKKSDRFSGPPITILSILVGLASIFDFIFKFSLFDAKYQVFFESIGTVLIIIGFTFRNLALKKLGNSFNYAVAPLKSELITRGVYKYIRHPAYLGTCLYIFSVALFFMSKLGLILVLLVVIAVLYRISVEEKFLEKNTHGAYIKYQQKTWKMIPWIY